MINIQLNIFVFHSVKLSICLKFLRFNFYRNIILTTWLPHVQLSTEHAKIVDAMFWRGGGSLLVSFIILNCIQLSISKPWIWILNLKDKSIAIVVANEMGFTSHCSIIPMEIHSVGAMEVADICIFNFMRTVFLQNW